MGGDFVNQNTMVWSGTAWYDAPIGMQIPVGQWTHLAFTVQDGTITVFVNGVQKFSGTNFPNVFTTTSGKLVTPQDSVESAGFSALVCAKSSHIILWSDLVHRNAV